MTYLPTERELAALRAYLAHGTCKGAGAEIGATEQAVKMILMRFRERAGVNSVCQLIFTYHAELAA